MRLHLERFSNSIVGHLLQWERGHRHLHIFLRIIEIDIWISLPYIQPGDVVAIYHGVALVGGVGHHWLLRLGGEVVSVDVPVLVPAIGPNHCVSIDPGLYLSGGVGADGYLLMGGEVIEIDVPFVLTVPGIDPDNLVACHHRRVLERFHSCDLLLLSSSDIIEIDLFSTRACINPDDVIAADHSIEVIGCIVVTWTVFWSSGHRERH